MTKFFLINKAEMRDDSSAIAKHDKDGIRVAADSNEIVAITRTDDKQVQVWKTAQFGGGHYEMEPQPSIIKYILVKGVTTDANMLAAFKVQEKIKNAAEVVGYYDIVLIETSTDDNNITLEVTRSVAYDPSGTAQDTTGSATSEVHTGDVDDNPPPPVPFDWTPVIIGSVLIGIGVSLYFAYTRGWLDKFLKKTPAVA